MDQSPSGANQTQIVQIQAKIDDPRIGITSEMVFNAVVDSQLSQAAPYGLGRQWVAMAYTAAAIGVHRHVVGTWLPQASTNTIVEMKQGRSEHYNLLRAAVDELASLDDEESQFIDDDAHKEGLRLLKIMDLTNVPPPSIFSHGGDSLVFSWQLGSAKRYLTPLDGIARLREYKNDDPGHASLSQDFELSDQSQTVRLLKYVGGSEWTAAKT